MNRHARRARRTNSETESASDPNVVVAPTPEVLKACDLIEETIGRFLEACETLPPLGRYESKVEALKLFTLVIRDIEGVLALARTDIVLLPAALPTARAAVEIAVKALWMIEPVDPFDGELRWLAHLREQQRFLVRVATALTNLGLDSVGTKRRAEELGGFIESVVAVLPQNKKELKGNPSVEQLILTGAKEFYPSYMELSQFVHGGHAGTQLYRRGLGTEKVHGEFVAPRSWSFPLEVCWSCLFKLGHQLLNRLSESESVRFASEQDDAKMQRLLIALARQNP